MTFHQFLLALRARRGVFGLVLLVTLLAALATSLLMPKTYKATASLLVDAKDQQSIAANNTRQPLQATERIGYLQTQMDILTSKKVARQVLHDLSLPTSTTAGTTAPLTPQAEAAIDDKAVEDLQKKLKVETSQSNVIQVSFQGSDRDQAARMANAFTDAYLDTVLQLRTAPSREASAWFNDQIKMLRTNLDNAQNALIAYRKQHGITTDDGRGDTAQLGALSDQIARAQVQTLQSSNRAQRARARLPDEQESGTIQRLRADLAAGEAKLGELATQYGPNYPLYERQQAENTRLRAQLASENARVQQALEAAARESRQQEVDLRSSLATQRAKLFDLNDDRSEFVILRHNVESAMQAYDTAMQRFVVSQVESRANQSNVTLLSRAYPPGRALRPNTPLNMALALAIGLLLGLGAVVLLEMQDRRVRSVHDLDFDVPLLAELNTWRRGASSQPRLPMSGGPSTPALPNAA